MILVEDINNLKQAILDVEASYQGVLQIRQGWGDYLHPIACCFEEDIIFKKNILYLSSIVRSVEKTLGGKLNKNNLESSLLIEIKGEGEWIVVYNGNMLFIGSYKDCLAYMDRKPDLHLVIQHVNNVESTRKARVLKICSIILHSRNISVFGEHVLVEDNNGCKLSFSFEEFITTLKQCVDIGYKDMINNMCGRLKNELNSGKMNGTISFEVNWLLENSFGSFVSDLDKKYISFCNHNFIEYFLRQECDCNSVSDIIFVLPVKQYAVLYQSGMNPNEMSLGFIWKGLKQWIQPDQRIYISQVLQSIQDYTNSHSDSMEKFYLKMKKYKQKYKQVSKGNCLAFLSTNTKIVFEEIEHLE